MKRMLAALLAAVLLYPFALRSAQAAGPETAAASAILVDAASGRVLYEKNAHEPRLIASITKLMTALVTVETTSDLEQRASLSSQCYSNLIAANAAMAGFAPGEAVTIRDLLHGLLLSSGADAAEALAEFVSGS